LKVPLKRKKSELHELEKKKTKEKKRRRKVGELR